ncbi:hypothetical protein PQR36_04880 [Paraburkholderia nemoris]|uniref:hypothetical protein n=1 Tax=Paraburkholderia TaxID=1822464 RepID=UPI0038B9228B
MHVSLQQTLTHSPLALPVRRSFVDEITVLVQKRIKSRGVFCTDGDTTTTGTNATVE